MIVTSFNKWKAIALTLAAVLAVLLVGGGVLYYRVVTNIDPRDFGDTHPLDAKEAGRKLKLFEVALHGGAAGFIRLSRAEVNSMIDEQFGSRSTNAPARAAELVRCRIDFNPAALTVCCWVRSSLFGRETTVAWQRTGSIARSGDRWVFRPVEMKLGEQVVPPRFWEQVEARLGSVDAALIERCSWLTQVPAIHFAENDYTRQAELRLFTYQETNLLTRVK